MFITRSFLAFSILFAGCTDADKFHVLDHQQDDRHQDEKISNTALRCAFNAITQVPLGENSRRYAEADKITFVQRSASYPVSDAEDVSINVGASITMLDDKNLIFYAWHTGYAGIADTATIELSRDFENEDQGITTIDIEGENYTEFHEWTSKAAQFLEYSWGECMGIPSPSVPGVDLFLNQDPPLNLHLQINT